MSEVEALGFEEVECGRKVAETKKRFKWRFRINGTSYMMELANSTLSGKRIVTLNSMEIYTEKNLLNINFDFTHRIEGHILRITRIPDNLNKFEMRIDNRSFEEMLEKGGWGKEEKSETKVNAKKEFDPFSDFGSFVNNKTESKPSNDFGQFDMDFAFSAKPSTTTSAAAAPAPKVQSSFDPFGFDNPRPPNPSSYQTVNFQTNTFQTNNFGNFAQKFSKVQQNLLDEQSFATNTYNKNNLYNDLMKKKAGQASDEWSDFSAPPKQEKDKGFLSDKINFDNFKIQMSAKQVFNKVKQTAEEIKMKVTGYNDSLI